MKKELIINKENIKNKIYTIRGLKVIFGKDLAKVYGIETRVLNQAVKRNIQRFPLNFMFQLNEEEIKIMVSQNVIPSKSYLGGFLPYAFTEQGVAMLSAVLKSKTAVKVTSRSFIKGSKQENIRLL